MHKNELHLTHLLFSPNGIQKATSFVHERLSPQQLVYSSILHVLMITDAISSLLCDMFHGEFGASN